MRKLSVIVPVYNVEPYLRRCVDSLLKQTYDDLEIILIDDGSTDASSDICKEYAAQYGNICFVRQENAGVSAARNRGMSLAMGAYVTFVDGDDWVEPTMFHELVAAMEKYSVPLAIGGYVDDYDGHTSLFFHPREELVLRNSDLMKEFFLQNLFMWTVYDKVYRCDFLRNLEFDSSLSVGEDMKFVWNVFARVREAVYVPLYQYHYCHRMGSAMQRRFSANYLGALKVKSDICRSIDLPYLRRYAKIVYMGEAAGVFRTVLASGAKEFYVLIRTLQGEVRRNAILVFACLKDNILTKRQRLGLLFMCLPFSLCRVLRFLICKKYDDDFSA